MKVFILLSVVVAAFAKHQCGENEHWESCGTACPLTCDNYENPPRFCVLRCDIGCFCDEGYVRSADGRCVKPEQCPAKSQECGENEHWESCGTACPLTCDNYENPPRVCVLRCDIGCFCDKGYVRTSDGRCVKPEECPAKSQGTCGANQRYEECGTVCPLTCENYANPPLICPAMCVSGCQCEKGFVKTKDGRCVRPEDCQNTAAAPSACRLEKAVGRCKAYFVRYFYNTETQKCEEFIYGGCEGNSNNFNSLEDCEAVCSS